ncbi:MAG TPA: NADH-quinone oxidoreductase subunit M [Polyangiaceae bacterium]
MKRSFSAFVAFLSFVAFFLVAGSSRAGGKVALAHDGGAGPLLLTLHEGVYRGEMTVTNAGDAPLVVSRVAPRGDDTDVRSPAKLSAKFVEGDSPSATIAVHAAKKVAVTWAPEQGSTARQLFGEIVVTSTDDAAGEVAMGVEAETPTAVPLFANHLLSWIVFLPLAGALVIFGLHLSGAGTDEIAQRIALGSSGAAALAALWAFRAFDGAFTRADGNDGFQLVERTSWIRSLGVEYFVGTDGLGIAVLLVAALGVFFGVVASLGAKRNKAHFALYLTVASAVFGLFVALDLVLFYAFWCLFWIAAYVLVATGTDAARVAANKLGFVGLVASVLLLFAISGLYDHSSRTFLVDGTSVAHTYTIPELMRVSYNDPGATMLGLPLVKALWITLFVPFLVLAGAAPVHTWLVDVVVESPGPVGALVAGVSVETGIYGILRFDLGILPEASRWAAGAIVGLGAAGILYGALCAFAQRDLKRFVAYACVSHAGIALLGIGSLTPEGLAGTCIEMCAHVAIVAVLLLAIGAIEDRARTRRLDELTGVGKQMPLLGGAFVLSLAASFGVPGLVGFWGECLSAVGAYPGHRFTVLVAVLGFALVAAAHVKILDAFGFGKLDEGWQKNPYLEPFGGKFPDLSTRELASVGPLVILIVILGLWPAGILSTVTSGVRDASDLVNPPGPDQVADVDEEPAGALASR